MKIKFNLSLILIVFCTLIAFKVGEHVELTDFLNARRTPNFITKKNIVKTLSAGTTGEIKQIKKFYSGNLGFKVHLTSGPLRGSSYWVYYNKKDPSIKVTSKANPKKNKQEIPPEEISEETANDPIKPEAELEEDHEGTEDPEETELKAGIDFLQNSQTILGDVGNTITPCRDGHEISLMDDSEAQSEIPSNISDYPTKAENYICGMASDSEIGHKCGLRISSTSSNSSSKKSSDDIDVIDLDLNTNQVIKHAKLLTDDFTKSDLKVFEMFNTKRRPSQPLGFPGCSSNLTKVDNFELCRNHQTVESFLLRNDGPNAVVGKKDGMTSRVFQFRTEDNSLSDSHLEINDFRMSNSGATDAVVYRLMFFPRTQVPSAKLVNNQIELTLPNKEKVIFDKKTKQIIGGVLKEKNLNMNFGQSLNNNSVNYTGSGVVIKFDEVISKSATITKGSSSCTVKIDDLWYKDPNLKRTMFKAQYATDEGLNKYIQNKCGFGM